MRNRVIWFDLETTGLNPFHNKIIEIAAADNHGAIFQSLLKIEERLDPKVVEITKITDELLAAEGRDQGSVLREFHHYISGDQAQRNQRTFMIAHNGDSFDRMFLKTSLKRFGLQIPSHVYFIDSLHFSRMVLPHRTSFKQEYLAQMFKINNPNPHRALGDVLVLKSIWERLTHIWVSNFNGKDDIIHIYNSIYF